MIKWNKKTYERELKKGYWDLEPHFWYYAQLTMYGLFRTIVEEKLSKDNWISAIYGEFVCEGKPIKKGFYDNFNLMSKIVNVICKKGIKNENKKRIIKHN